MADVGRDDAETDARSLPAVVVGYLRGRDPEAPACSLHDVANHRSLLFERTGLCEVQVHLQSGDVHVEDDQPAPGEPASFDQNAESGLTPGAAASPRSGKPKESSTVRRSE